MSAARCSRIEAYVALGGAAWALVELRRQSGRPGSAITPEAFRAAEERRDTARAAFVEAAATCPCEGCIERRTGRDWYTRGAS